MLRKDNDIQLSETSQKKTSPIWKLVTAKLNLKTESNLKISEEAIRKKEAGNVPSLSRAKSDIVQIMWRIVE